MIHSLAGGELGENKVYNFAKLEFKDCKGEFFWFICPFDNIKAGDYVLAPFGKIDEPKKAKVIRVDKNVNGKSTPISTKIAKTIYKKL